MSSRRERTSATRLVSSMVRLTIDDAGEGTYSPFEHGFELERKAGVCWVWLSHVEKTDTTVTSTAEKKLRACEEVVRCDYARSSLKTASTSWLTDWL